MPATADAAGVGPPRRRRPRLTRLTRLTRRGDGARRLRQVRLNQERLRSVESLQGLAAELASMVHAANLPVLAVSCEGIVTEWNSKAGGLGFSLRVQPLLTLIPYSMNPIP